MLLKINRLVGIVIGLLDIPPYLRQIKETKNREHILDDREEIGREGEGKGYVTMIPPSAKWRTSSVALSPPTQLKATLGFLSSLMVSLK